MQLNLAGLWSLDLEGHPVVREKLIRRQLRLRLCEERSARKRVNERQSDSEGFHRIL
jgi:hypothetical protein